MFGIVARAVPGARGRRGLAIGIASTLIGAAMVSPVAGAGPGSGGRAGAARPAGALAECPDVMPVADVAAGQEGTGWTVVRGQTPEAFHVEVLGIIEDGVAPDRDIIVVEVSDEAGSDFIDRAGGIWAGMSGSPVYIGGELVGAVAYGFTAGPSPVGGLTPAEDMVRVLDYATGPAAARRTGAFARDTVVVPRGMRTRVAREAGISVTAAATMHRLPIPLAVSGLRARRLDRLERKLERKGTNVLVVSGSRATAPSGVPSGIVEPGGNFAAVISYGDVTAGGIGTTTYVCDGQALAFGHPLTTVGRVAFGASDADAITIVSDPTFTPFKLANVAEDVGVVDQDRLAAIRADLGRTPELIPVTARVRSWENGRIRTGETDVTMSEWIPSIAPFHVLSDIDTTIDRIGPGTAALEMVIEGTRPNGSPWELHRADRVASTFDVSGDAAFMLDELLAPIANNSFEDVHFDRVHVKAWISERILMQTIRRVRVSRNGGPFREPEQLRVGPGDELRLRVTLRIYRGAAHNVDVLLTVPDDASGDGFLDVTGGADVLGTECDSDPSACPTSLRRLIASLEDAPRTDSFVASLNLYDPVSGVVDTTAVTTTTQRVVFGSVSIPVLVLGG
jgi:hypothetical protein